jgi:2-polyprenyl-3-methyl-5-hydroxy-6-metoxy-1,4-benzoquinol methylase
MIAMAQRNDAGLTDTADPEYAERLVRLQHKWWKRLIDVQAPYRWKLQSLRPGFVLDIGCGIGRSLKLCRGHGVGIDHNARCVEVCRQLGYTAYLTDEFDRSPHNRPETFDSILVAHVAEHLKVEEISGLIRRYLPLLKPSGKVILITPQERGWRSDPTHVSFVDFTVMKQVFDELGLAMAHQSSYPFPRCFGNLFIYNEFVGVGQKLPHRD